MPAANFGACSDRVEWDNGGEQMGRCNHVFQNTLHCVSSVHFLGCAADTPSDTVTISLEDIWAYKMHGTKDVRELDNESEQLKGLPPDQFEKSFRALPVEQIISGIRSYLSTPRDAFVVKGTGTDALQRAKTVVVDQASPNNSLPASDDATIVFFTESSRFECHIANVEMHKNRIVISYRLEPYLEEFMTYQFALIPLGKLAPGNYSVEMVRLPTDPKFKNLRVPDVMKEYEQREISRPFSFTVNPN